MEARKVLIDPRLVDPKILRRVGLLGKVGVENSAKYKILVELLTDDNGPIANGEKVVIFSSMFRDGVSQPGNEKLRQKYKALGLEKEYEVLGLDESLPRLLEKALEKRFGRKFKFGVIDGEVPVDEREAIVDALDDELAGVACTTDCGGESLDFTEASYIVFLDKAYTPTAEDQGLARVLRKGQHKKVRSVHLTGKNTLDEQLAEYVERKRIITTMATDGYALTDDEWNMLWNSGSEQFIDMIRGGMGGTSINVLDVEITDLTDFEVKRKSRHSREARSQNYYTTTGAQEVLRRIGQNPIGCWFDKEFVELYMKELPNLSVPVVHRAKVADIVSRAKEREIEFPRTVLSDGSGPSLLYSAYQSLAELVEKSGFEIPVIWDRDISPLMLERGMNPNKVLGDMRGKPVGKDSLRVNDSVFDMVDNESISLLKNPEEVKSCLLESHRILVPNKGLIELVVQNRRFQDSFYIGMEKLGFEVLSEKNQGFLLSKDKFRRLKEQRGEHFAESYRAKLANTYLLLARKIDNPTQVDASNFWFETLGTDEPELSPRDPEELRSIIIPGRRRGRK